MLPFSFQRSELALNSVNPTLLTFERFQEWLVEHEKEEKARIAAEKAKAAAEVSTPTHKVMLSGKQLLIMKPQMAVDDADAMDEAEVERQTDEEFDRFQAIELQKALNKDSAGLVDEKYLVNYDDVAKELAAAEKAPAKQAEKEVPAEQKPDANEQSQ